MHNTLPAIPPATRPFRRPCPVIVGRRLWAS